MNEVGTSTATSEAGPSSVSSKRRVEERGIFWPKRRENDECNKILRALRTSEAPEDATQGVYRLSHAI